MDPANSNQDQPQAQPQPEALQQPPAQIPNSAAVATTLPLIDAAVLPPVGSTINGNGMPQFPGQLMNQGNAEPMTGIVPLMQDPSATAVEGMRLPDPTALLVPGNRTDRGHLPINGDGILSEEEKNLDEPRTISADEIALYDRQIRLWGIDAQAKIQNASILLITIKALAGEIAKNLVLAGVGSITLLDGDPVTETDLGAQFFLSECENLIGQNRAQAASAAIQKLNPRVKVEVDAEGIKTKGPSYFSKFDIVIATDLDPDAFLLINTATRVHGRAFYAAGSHGLYGFIFSDLIEHEYVIQRDAGNIPTVPAKETRTRSVIRVETRTQGPKVVESVTKRELYSTWFLASDVAVLPDEYLKSRRRLKSVTPALSCLRALWEFKQLQNGRSPSTRDDLKMFTQIATQKHKALNLPSETLRPEFLRSFLQNLDSEIAPVTAVLGGQLAQDVINVLGHTQQPIQNMVVFDGNSMEALMYPLHPEGPLGNSMFTLGGSAPADPSMMANGANPMMMPPPMDASLMTLGVDPTSMGALPHHPMIIPDANTLGPMPILDNSLPGVLNTSQISQPQAVTQAPPAPTAQGGPNGGAVNENDMS